MLKPLVAISLAVLLARCQDPANRDDAAEGPPTFVASAPDVSIGELEGDDPYLFGYVSDATRLSNGTVAVANCLTAEVRWFDRQGRHVRSAGGRGQGPGEFNFLRRLFPAGGDTVGAFDPFLGRITMLALDGGVRTINISPSGRAAILGRLGGGLFVARRYPGLPDGGSPGEVGRATTPLLLIDSEGRAVDSIPDLPDFDFRVPSGSNRRVSGLRMGRIAVFAVLPDRILYGAQDEAGVLEFDESLEQIGVTETVTRPQPISDTEEAEFQAMLDAGGHIAGSIGPAYTSSYAPIAPAFRDIIGGRDGNVWVEDPYRHAYHPLVWTSYEQGRATRRVELPPKFFPFEFGSDWVLGVSYDSLSIERIELRRFESSDLPLRRLWPREGQPPTSHRCGAWASR